MEDEEKAPVKKEFWIQEEWPILKTQMEKVEFAKKLNKEAGKL